MSTILKYSKTKRNLQNNMLQNYFRRSFKKIFPEAVKVHDEFLETFSNIQKSRILGGPTSFIRSEENISHFYIFNIRETTTEKNLKDRFSKFGVKFLELRRNDFDKNGKQYAKVKFFSEGDARKAFENFNFTIMDGNKVRINWPLGKVKLSSKTESCVTVSNLHSWIDNRVLFKAFNVFGPIISSRVHYGFGMKSKCSGWVFYEDPESAEDAIEGANGLEVNGKVLEIKRFVEVRHDDTEENFSKIFVNNMRAEEFPNRKVFLEFFEKFGKISSHYFLIDEDGLPKGQAFVEFEDPRVAAKLVKSPITKDGTIINVRKHSFWLEKNRVYRDSQSELKPKAQVVPSRKLIVFNLPLSVDNGAFRNKFCEFGELESARLIFGKDGNPTGSGLVCFAKMEDATTAREKLLKNIWETKRVYIEYLPEKE